jgi:quercetin dioxygenase-like cupin family protein
MRVVNAEKVAGHPVSMEGAHKCHVRWLVGQDDGAPNFAMRQFEIEPGGHTPRHQHDYEHEVFVLGGQGEVWEGDRRIALVKGDVVLVSPGEVHQFRNTGSEPFTFLCLIPHCATGKRVTVVPECGVERRSL